jgi:hypothetical protein
MVGELRSEKLIRSNNALVCSSDGTNCTIVLKLGSEPAEVEDFAIDGLEPSSGFQTLVLRPNGG